MVTVVFPVSIIVIKHEMHQYILRPPNIWVERVKNFENGHLRLISVLGSVD